MVNWPLKALLSDGLVPTYNGKARNTESKKSGWRIGVFFRPSKVNIELPFALSRDLLDRSVNPDVRISLLGPNPLSLAG